MKNRFFFRPAKLRGLAFLGLLLTALIILAAMIWRTNHHFKTVVSYVNYSHRVQKVSLGLQQSLIGYWIKDNRQPKNLSSTLSEMDVLMANDHYLPDNTKRNLLTVRNMLTDIGKLNNQEINTHLISALEIMDETLDHEASYREQLLEDINLDTQNELYIALGTFFVILLGALLFLRFRILHPLHGLRSLLEHLADGNYAPFATDHLDPLLLPVFNSYNNMVVHLAELEEAKRLYAQSLQREVRLATQALLEQQSSLARAERLAATGEMAAELAHEIRNPLAGIQMAFSNLRKEIDDQFQSERMELISSELKRLALLLNDMLNQGKHSPEVARDFDLPLLINDLLKLARYQIAENIHLEVDAPVRLPVHLPESGIRQVLLNLILNSVVALDGSPGYIKISVKTDAQGLSIAVLDNGHGFSRELLDYGIRPFLTSHTHGTGLGLAMVQRFAKNIEGTIKLSNREPHGASVILLLPNDCLPGDSQ